MPIDTADALRNEVLPLFSPKNVAKLAEILQHSNEGI